jgi:hypothetical protein
MRDEAYPLIPCVREQGFNGSHGTDAVVSAHRKNKRLLPFQGAVSEVDGGEVKPRLTAFRAVGEATP